MAGSEARDPWLVVNPGEFKTVALSPSNMILTLTLLFFLSIHEDKSMFCFEI